ncbi:MAG: response regulator [Phycisphaerales bacterium JB063]
MSEAHDNTPAHRAERQAGTNHHTKPRPRRLLLVDRDPALRAPLERCADANTTVLYADTLASARAMISQQRDIDVAVIDPDLADGSGLDLVNELAGSKHATQSVVVSANTAFDLAQQAMRVGASDFLVKSQTAQGLIDAALLADRVRAALDRQQALRDQVKQIRRLKKLCKRLDAARAEVSDQVDVLCNDLVTAYQELAVQMQDAVASSGFTAVLGEELDLEVVLRKTLEYLVAQAGPCNAAIFLPATMDEYSLGGYVNYDCSGESADMLLEHLGDVLAPRVGGCVEVMHLTDNAAMRKLLGDDWNYLADCNLVTFACFAEEEPLAVVVLFRDESQPFPVGLVETCRSVADVLGESLAKIIRVHHRAGLDDEVFGEAYDNETLDADTFLPLEEWDGSKDKPGLFETDEDDALEDDDLPF